MSIPAGLYLTDNFIDTQLEAQIIHWLDNRIQNPWSTALSRRTQHFGYEYNYKGGALKATEPIAGPLLTIRDHLKSLGIIDANQIIVNEYYRNQGIAPHIDSNVFGPVIVGISLNDSCIMNFTRNEETFNINLPSRSIMMMTGESRYSWKHGIDKAIRNKAGNYRRISLTFRSVN